MVWAVPVEGRASVGRFWAFFPLRDETTLTGIANAPWQVNDDRVGLLEGSQLNRELLDELSRLVLTSVPTLTRKNDPGWVLDILPARGSEARCWGDSYLTTHFYDLAPGYPLVPDQDGDCAAYPGFCCRLPRLHGRRWTPGLTRRAVLHSGATPAPLAARLADHESSADSRA